MTAINFTIRLPEHDAPSTNSLEIPVYNTEHYKVIILGKYGD